jgi:hypothetical protein
MIFLTDNKHVSINSKSIYRKMKQLLKGSDALKYDPKNVRLSTRELHAIY